MGQNEKITVSGSDYWTAVTKWNHLWGTFDSFHQVGKPGIEAFRIYKIINMNSKYTQIKILFQSLILQMANKTMYLMNDYII